MNRAEREEALNKATECLQHVNDRDVQKCLGFILDVLEDDGRTTYERIQESENRRLRDVSGIAEGQQGEAE